MQIQDSEFEVASANQGRGMGSLCVLVTLQQQLIYKHDQAICSVLL